METESALPSFLLPVTGLFISKVEVIVGRSHRGPHIRNYPLGLNM